MATIPLRPLFGPVKRCSLLNVIVPSESRFYHHLFAPKNMLLLFVLEFDEPVLDADIGGDRASS